MKLGPKNIEGFFIIGLVLITIIEFLVFAGGIQAETHQTTLLLMTMFMVVAGELIISILLLRIYDLIDTKKVIK